MLSSPLVEGFHLCGYLGETHLPFAALSKCRSQSIYLATALHSMSVLSLTTVSAMFIAQRKQVSGDLWSPSRHCFRRHGSQCLCLPTPPLNCLRGKPTSILFWCPQLHDCSCPLPNHLINFPVRKSLTSSHEQCLGLIPEMKGKSYKVVAQY